MANTLALNIEYRGQEADGLRFRMQIRNASSAKLLAPRPAISCLYFGNLTTGKPAVWHVKPREAASWNGFVFESGDEKETEYHVRPSSVAAPRDDDVSEYARCSIDLVPGSYLVWLRLQVDEDFVCQDSLFRYPDLVWLAMQEQAVVWKGQAMSDRFKIDIL